MKRGLALILLGVAGVIGYLILSRPREAQGTTQAQPTSCPEYYCVWNPALQRCDCYGI